jgi:hypothetical protein
MGLYNVLKDKEGVQCEYYRIGMLKIGLIPE